MSSRPRYEPPPDNLVRTAAMAKRLGLGGMFRESDFENARARHARLTALNGCDGGSMICGCKDCRAERAAQTERQTQAAPQPWDYA